MVALIIFLSLNVIPHNAREMWTKKQKRAYHRAKSGVKVAEILHQPIKHLVLTTSPAAANRNIANDFQVLRKRIYRRFGVLLPYFMVRTNEGNGVLHILFRSKQYIPRNWLIAHWSDIHKSHYVYIKEPPTDVAYYVVTQYVAGQGSSYQRCSWSQNWVCKGFVKQWKEILHQTRDWKNQTFNYDYYLWTAPVQISLALAKWDEWLMSQAIKQTTII